jgi:hypothetical protein
VLTRLALILALALHPVLLRPVVGATAAATPPCVDQACCEVVQYTTCCGETVTERQCRRSGGGDCRCVAAPSDGTPTPTPPLPRTAPDWNTLLLPTGAPLTVGTPTASGVASLAQTRHLGPGSHHLRQALLGIWRT